MPTDQDEWALALKGCFSGPKPKREAQIRPQGFVYDHLKPGHIRLLRIDPSSPLHLQIREFELDLAPDFYVLSYVWGNAKPDKKILLNEKSFYITRTVLKAIEAFTCRSTTAEMLWVDAICINQVDLEEKSRQIPFMHDIWVKARAMIIWFGEVPQETWMAIEVLRWIEIHREQQMPGKDQSDASLKKGLSQTIRRDHGIEETHMLALNWVVSGVEKITQQHHGDGYPESKRDALFKSPLAKDMLPPQHPFWASFLLLMMNDWYKRVWTYQEACLARFGWLIWETRRLNWGVVEIFRDTLMRKCYPLWSDATTLRKLATYDLDLNFLRISGSRVGRMQPNMQGRFLKYLLECCIREATDPKDYIYGVLGLLDSITRGQIEVDYSKTDEAVFVDAIRVALQNDEKGSANFPRLWETFPPKAGANPSWCPDFTVGFGVQSYDDTFGLHLSIIGKFRDAAVVKFECGTQSIAFRALQMDKVLRCASRTSRRFDVNTILSLPASSPQAQVHSTVFASHLCDEHRDWLVALEQTFQGPSKSKLRKFFDSHETNVHHDLSEMLRYCNTLHFDQNEDFRAREQNVRLSSDYADGIRYSMSQLCILHGGRYFFETSSGRVGFASQPLSQGDKILLVPGGLRLHVVSSDGEKYIGSAYIDGMGDEQKCNELIESGSWEIFTVS